MLSPVIPFESIKRKILTIRDHKVMLDADLAYIYGVSTKRLNEQVKRNHERFPKDFMFLLTKEEKDEVVAICDHLEKLKFSPNLPYAFTEYGAVMVASVLNTPVAIQMSVQVVRAFIKLREIIATHKEPEYRLAELEGKVDKHDEEIKMILEAIHQLMTPPQNTRRKVGFIKNE
ncbi:MAG: ORF6N domain-containing protein [Firmicutes bacterium]|nr:ORF6N domain-containing protein [Bacillota bacterium]